MSSVAVEVQLIQQDDERQIDIWKHEIRMLKNVDRRSRYETKVHPKHRSAKADSESAHP